MGYLDKYRKGSGDIMIGRRPSAHPRYWIPRMLSGVTTRPMGKVLEGFSPGKSVRGMIAGTVHEEPCNLRIGETETLRSFARFTGADGSKILVMAENTLFGFDRYSSYRIFGHKSRAIVWASPSNWEVPPAFSDLTKAIYIPQFVPENLLERL